jgi:hypothetical protein
MASMSLPIIANDPKLTLDKETRLYLLQRATEYKSTINLADNIGISENEFNRVNKHSLVAICNIFETALEDLLIGLFINDDNPFQKLTPLGLGKLKFEDFGFLAFEKAEYLVKRIRRPIQEKEGFIGSYNKIFECFSIDADNTEIPLEKIDEAKQIRNCIVHKNGQIDFKAVEKFPALNEWLGKTIIIPEKSYLQYHNALGTYMNNLYNIILKTEYCYKAER